MALKVLSRHPVVDLETGLVTPQWQAWLEALIASVLTVAQGGTGVATWVPGDLLFASAVDTLMGLTAVAKGAIVVSGGVSTAPRWLPAGTSGHVLTGQGADTDPMWASPAHTLLSAGHSDVTPGTVLRGDLLLGQGATPRWARKGKGAVNAVLLATATDVDWSSTAAVAMTQLTVGAAGAGAAVPATPAGYLLVNLAGTDVAIPYYAAV